MKKISLLLLAVTLAAHTHLSGDWPPPMIIQDSSTHSPADLAQEEIPVSDPSELLNLTVEKVKNLVDANSSLTINRYYTLALYNRLQLAARYLAYAKKKLI